jgi:hypothetical protein
MSDCGLTVAAAEVLVVMAAVVVEAAAAAVVVVVVVAAAGGGGGGWRRVAVGEWVVVVVDECRHKGLRLTTSGVLQVRTEKPGIRPQRNGVWERPAVLCDVAHSCVADVGVKRERVSIVEHWAVVAATARL